MISLLIVDDEKDILEGLKSTIRWRLLGIDTVKTAENGLEALGILKETNIDIVVTDIKMPGMDGIELARWIYHNYPRIRVIVLSGYSEFEYAKSAMEFGVSRYLLKPIVIKELLEAVFKTKKEILKRFEDENKNEQVKKEFGALQEKFLLDMIIKRKTAHKDLLEGFEKYCIKRFNFPYVLINVRLYPPDGDCSARIDTRNIREYLKFDFQVTDECGYLLEDALGHFYIIYEMTARKEILPSKLTECKEKIKHDYGVEVKIGVSETFHSLLDLCNAYEQADTVLKRMFFDEYRDIYFYDGKIKYIGNSNNELALKQVLIRMYKNNEIFDAATLDEFYRKLLRDDLCDEEAIKDMSRSILNIILQNCLEKSIYSLVYDKYVCALSSIKSCRKFSRLTGIIHGFLQYVCEVGRDQQIDSKTRIVYEVKEFIKNNYSKNLDINEVSGIIKRSPNYLSHIFSELSGETFSEYLNRIRIEKSKELLRNSDFTIYRIAREVGYSDEKYYIKIFKKNMACTPSQYRNLVLENRNEDGYR